jgi:hypothetical protein
MMEQLAEHGEEGNGRLARSTCHLTNPSAGEPPAPLLF